MATIEKSIEVDVPVGMAYNQWTQLADPSLPSLKALASLKGRVGRPPRKVASE